MNDDRRSRILIVGPMPPPYAGWAHGVSSLMRPPFDAAFEMIPFDTNFRSGARRLSSRSGQMANAARQILGFGTAARRANADFGIIFSGPGGSSWRDLVLLRNCHRMGLPVLVRFIGGLITRKIAELPRPLRAAVLATLAPARAFLVETHDMVDELATVLPGARVYRIPNFIHAEDLRATVPGADGDISPGVGYLGNMTATKGVEVVLNAVDQVCDQRAVAFHFIGGERESGYLDRFRAMAAGLRHASAVHVHGQLSRDEAHRLLATQCQVFAFPSSWPGEGQPAALVEAMGMGLVPVATRWRGIADIVRHDANGLLIDSPDPDQLAVGLLNLFSDAARLQRMSRAAQETIRAEYEAGAALGQFQRIFEELGLCR